MTDVESLSASLVREYLSRKGFKRSLRVLDEEFPRTGDSIRNRIVLAKELKIEKIMRINKEIGTPLRTMIEVMAKYFISDRVNKKSPKDTNDDKQTKASSLKKSVSVHDIRGESQLYQSNESLFNKQLDRALSVTSENSSKAGKIRRRSSGNNSINLLQESVSFNSDSRSTLPSSNGISEKVGFKSKAERLGLEPVLDRNNKIVRTKGQIQSTVEPRGKANKKKPLDFIGNGLLGREAENSLREIGFQQDTDYFNHFNEEHVDKKKTRESDVVEQRMPIDRSYQEASFKTKSVSDIMIFDDIDDDLSEDLDNMTLDVPGRKTISKLHDNLQSMTLESATNLKNVIFGSSSKSFNPEWRNQSFSFCDLPELEYGIVQMKGGPCGLLAAVQATVLKHLLFEKEWKSPLKRPPAPSSKERTMALANSLTEILWRAGARKSACVALPLGKSKFVGGGRYKSDGLTETLSIYTFKDIENLKTFVSQNIGLFESESSSGCSLFLYSLALSRGLKRVKSDMDEANGVFIGSHGYCTQDLVNLCLTGKAVSNVFDGMIELDSGGTSKSVLKGIENQSDVGLMSLFEHYESCKVGDNYKTPKYPIWVVCSESHFSTLFCIDQRLLQDRQAEKQFDLYYYDGLARQDEEIRLTVDTRDGLDPDTEDLVPPLDHCIRTKWKNANVDWNGTEPLL